MVILLTSCSKNDSDVSSVDELEGHIQSNEGVLSTNDEEDAKQPPQDTHIYEYIDESLTIDAEIVYPSRKLTGILGVEFLEFDSSYISEYLLREKNISLEDSSEAGVFYTADDGSTLWVGTYDLHYEANESKAIHAVFTDQEDSPVYNVDSYAKSNLDFISVDDAFLEVQNFFTGMGINIYEQYEYRSLDVATMQEQLARRAENPLLDQKDKEGNSYGEITQDNECYYFEITASIEDIPVSTLFHGDGVRGYYQGTSIRVLYGSDGIIKVTMYAPYTLVSVVDNDVETISVATALETVKDKYNNIIPTGNTVIVQASLEMVITGSDDPSIPFFLTPMWVFKAEHTLKLEKKTLEEETPSDYVNKVNIFVDGITGKEIL